MNLHMVQKKGYYLSSQQNEQEVIVPYKNNKAILLENKMPMTCMMKWKATIPKITSPAMMEECEVIDEFIDEISPVVGGVCKW